MCPILGPMRTVELTKFCSTESHNSWLVAGSCMAWDVAYRPSYGVPILGQAGDEIRSVLTCHASLKSSRGHPCNPWSMLNHLLGRGRISASGTNSIFGATPNLRSNSRRQSAVNVNPRSIPVKYGNPPHSAESSILTTQLVG